MAQRDTKWQEQFLQNFGSALVSVVNPQPQEGPDGWPYLLVETSAASAEKVVDIVRWVSTRGIGLCLNPQKTEPDFVFPYGVLWNFLERGEFLSAAPARPSGRFELKAGAAVRTGPVTPQILPDYARKVIKDFLAQQGIFMPSIMMISFDNVTYDVCFSMESLRNPPAHEHAGIAEALAWFLPAHYTVSLVSEKAVPGFQRL